MVAEVTEVSCFSWVKLLTVLAIKFFSAELHNDTSQRKFWMMLLCQTEVTSFSLATVPCCLVLKTGSKFREVLLNITGWLEHLNNCLSVLAHFCCHPNTFSLTIYMRQWQGKGFKQLGMTGTPNCCQQDLTILPYLPHFKSTVWANPSRQGEQQATLIPKCHLWILNFYLDQAVLHMWVISCIFRRRRSIFWILTETVKICDPEI